ncbi:alpha/beta hydrolase [Rhodococcus sp. D2-41]|nr:alpha/beta hydrolase [Rhodococcus sp. D2-41]
MQSRALDRTLRVTIRPVLEAWSRSTGLRWPTGIVDHAGRLLPAIDGTRVTHVRLDHCAADWVRGPGAGDERVILYLHGGAFLCCGLHTHRRLVSQISASAKAPALMVDYRMFPQHTISDAITDGMDGYRWLLRRGYRPSQIIVAGDSAGGYLSFMVPLAIRAAGLPRPAAVVALSPLTELDPRHKLEHRNARRCALFPRHAVPALTALSDRLDADAERTRGQAPRACPVDSDLRGMPPTLVQAGSHEMLLTDAELIAERLAEAGVPTELQVWDRQVHVFQAAFDLVPEGRRAIEEIARFIRTTVPPRLSAVR